MSIHVDRFSDDFEIEIFQPGSLTGSLKKKIPMENLVLMLYKLFVKEIKRSYNQ